MSINSISNIFATVKSQLSFICFFTTILMLLIMFISIIIITTASIKRTKDFKIINYRLVQFNHNIILYIWTFFLLVVTAKKNNVDKLSFFHYDVNEFFFFIKKSSFISVYISPFSFFFIFITNLVIVLTYKIYTESKSDFSWKNLKFLYDLKKNEKSNNVFCLMLVSLTWILYLLFTTTNLIAFFIFFELSVLPLMGLITFFSKRSQKFRAKSYLLFFTLFSGVPFFIAIVWLWKTTNSLEIFTISKNISYIIFVNKITISELLCVFIAFFLPFIVKGALFPFHGWLPEAHVEASTEGSIILSGILLKVGFFGLIKFMHIFFFPVYFLCANYAVPFFIFTMLIPTASLFIVNDAKKVIAYYSIAHMHSGIIGALCGSALALEGSIFINYTHALTSAGLFACIGYLFDKAKTRNFIELGGLDFIMPNWSINFFILLLSNAGIPGTAGFIPELCIYSGVIIIFPWEAFVLLFATSVGAVRSFILFNQLSCSINFNFQSGYPANIKQLKIIYNKKFFIIKESSCSSAEQLTSISWISNLCIFFGVWSTKLINLMPRLF